MVRTGILCHGRHLLANNWELHQWGDADNEQLGQILKTCQLAYNEKPEIIVFGTGASEKDGVKESEYTIKYMMDNFDRMKDFSKFKEIDLGKLKIFMHSHSIAEKESKKTFEELEKAGEIFLNHGVTRVILVSNPDHISRCMQLAHEVFSQPKFSSFKQILAAQSEVGYNGTQTITSRIIEMPHRGDDSSPNLAKYIGDYFKLSLERKRKFVSWVKDFLQTD